MAAKSDSLLFDKSVDLVLMFLGLYAAMAVQDFADHHKDKQQYKQLLTGFQEELESNRIQRTNIEEKLGALNDLKEIGQAGNSFEFFTAQTTYMRSFLDCYSELKLGDKKTKISPERKKECVSLLKKGFRQKAPEHLALTPVYRRDVWRFYLAGGVQLFQTFEKPTGQARCQVEGQPSTGLAICIGSIYNKLSVVEQQVRGIQNLVNDTYFNRQGILDAEFKEFKRQMKVLGKRTDAEAVSLTNTLVTRLHQKLNEGQLAVDLSLSMMKYKIKQLKRTADTLDQRFAEVLSALNNEIK